MILLFLIAQWDIAPELFTAAQKAGMLGPDAAGRPRRPPGLPPGAPYAFDGWGLGRGTCRFFLRLSPICMAHVRSLMLTKRYASS